MTQTHYQVLGVARSADRDAIKSAYRKATLRAHSDRGGDDAKFRAVREAYDVLSDPKRRQVYDENLFGVSSGGPDAYLDEVHTDLELPWLTAAHGGRLLLRIDLTDRPSFNVNLDVPAGVAVGKVWRMRSGFPPIALCITLRAIRGQPAHRGSRPNWRTQPAARCTLHGALDVHTQIYVGLATLLVGGPVSVEAPDGFLSVTLPPKSLAPLRVSGKGFFGGDLIVEIAILWPSPGPDLLAELRRHT